MGMKEFIEVMRAEVLNRLREERKKRKESLKIRLNLPSQRGNFSEVERKNRLL